MSFVVVAAVSVVVTVWAMLFNTVFDHIERHHAGRVASQRPHRLRWLHAMLLEGSAVVVSCPVIVALTPLTWGQAVLADLGLTLAYAVYAYVFHLAFDRLRPVASA